MERQTDIAQTIELAADRARYDECAKKLLTYKAVIAWILKSCTKEFSQYSVKFICDNCLNENVELSEHAVHQDQLNRDERLNGDHSFFVLMFHAKLIPICLTDRTTLICPAVPDMAVKIMDIVGFLLPDPEDLIHGTL